MDTDKRGGGRGNLPCAGPCHPVCSWSNFKQNHAGEHLEMNVRGATGYPGCQYEGRPAKLACMEAKYPVIKYVSQ